MRIMGMLLAACALAACGAGDGNTAADDARSPASTPAPADSGNARAPAAASSAAGDTAHTFRLYESEPGVVDSISVTRGGRVVQVIRPSENQVPPDREIERIDRVDLDYDGHADLGFITELSMAGSRSEYWRLDPATGRFAPAGVYETLQADSAAREHTTHIRGGHGGRLWTASRWRWVDGALAEVRREEQDVAEDGGRYVHVIHERRNGALAETSRDTLEEHEIRGAATWVEP